MENICSLKICGETSSVFQVFRLVTGYYVDLNSVHVKGRGTWRAKARKESIAQISGCPESFNY